METNSDIIDELGGTGAVAAMLGLKAPAVSNWRRLGIPPRHWYKMVNARPNRITFELLEKLNPIGKRAA